MLILYFSIIIIHFTPVRYALCAARARQRLIRPAGFGFTAFDFPLYRRSHVSLCLRTDLGMFIFN